MKLFYESDSSIFKNENALSLEYLPPEMPERETQLKELAAALNSSAKGKRGRNILVTGPTGTGKTSCVKYVLNQLTEFSQTPIAIYINCWNFTTSNAVLSEIAERLKLPLPRRGIAFDEIFKRIKEYLTVSNKVLVVVLDEVDRLLANNSTEILYYLSRGDELASGKISVIVVSNDDELPAKLDDRIRSSLLESRVKFEKYTAFQLKKILSERAKLAFFSSAITEEVVALCAANAAKQGGDARVGISLLYQAGLNAEREGSNKVLIKHIKLALEEVKNETDFIARHFDSLSDTEKRIVNLLLTGPLTSGEIYEKLSDLGISNRMLQFYITKLEESGMVTSQEIEVKPKGRTKLISLRK
ncbi:MAG: AAA family ATPase [Candidatus Micrarchaeota archaeon]|nr:AAA family ATPase [Candidatus Micrarchaeota archaeon]